MTAAICFGVAYVCTTVLFLLGCAISRRMANRRIDDEQPELVCSGEYLTQLADLYGCERIQGKRLWWTLWLFKSRPESDAQLRARIMSDVFSSGARQ